MPTKLFCVLAAAGVIFMTGCAMPFELRDYRVLDVSFDEESQSTKVRVAFEIWDLNGPVTDLTEDDFSAFEDGQESTSESFDAAQAVETKVEVALVLDTSSSMYDADAIAALKASASSFVADLRTGGFDVSAYRFGRTIARIDSVSQIPDTAEGNPQDERWTSLYYAINEIAKMSPDAIIVVFSDGADNYSENFDVDNRSVMRRLERTGQTVHVIGYGNVAEQRDRKGLEAGRALRGLARSGTYYYAASAEEFAEIFSAVSESIRQLYIYDYFSPSLTGTHTLQVKVERDLRRAQSGLVNFTPPPQAKRAVAGAAGLDEGVVPAAHLKAVDPWVDAGNDDIANNAKMLGDKFVPLSLAALQAGRHDYLLNTWGVPTSSILRKDYSTYRYEFQDEEDGTASVEFKFNETLQTCDVEFRASKPGGILTACGFPWVDAIMTKSRGAEVETMLRALQFQPRWRSKAPSRFGTQTASRAKEELILSSGEWPDAGKGTIEVTLVDPKPRTEIRIIGEQRMRVSVDPPTYVGLVSIGLRW